MCQYVISHSLILFLTFHLIMRIVYFYDENRKSRDIEENMKLEVKL